ncbi:hypothetical protein Leryth_009257 [Lithospermum erythrorhizon]|nr:hypothetical protein Leryth_009257 [Lithospermum erythrorhizon]
MLKSIRKPRKLSDPTGNYSTFQKDARIENKFAKIIGEFYDSSPANLSYQLIATKQMVGFHLASGEKEGDELKRNADVNEILKHTQFPNVCKNSRRQVPERIIGHDRIIWLGDLNYRVALSYEETRNLLEDNDWDSILERDQLNLERQAGRVFVGFNEGKILFAPTYKPALPVCRRAQQGQEETSNTGMWIMQCKCDRILWLGSGIEQLSYIRGESRFSDHRPVCAVFAVEVEMKSKNSKFRKGYSYTGHKMVYEDCLPPRHSFC